MTPFRERMNLYRAYRELNPDKNYWDWKASMAALDGDWGYQKWKRNLPENLKYESPDYDLYGAYKAGMQPTLESDGTYHLGSRDPQTGRILKRKGHPTYLMAIDTEKAMGYDVYEGDDGYTYSQPRVPAMIDGGGIRSDDDTTAPTGLTAVDDSAEREWLDTWLTSRKSKYDANVRSALALSPEDSIPTQHQLLSVLTNMHNTPSYSFNTMNENMPEYAYTLNLGMSHVDKAALASGTERPEIPQNVLAEIDSTKTRMLEYAKANLNKAAKDTLSDEEYSARLAQHMQYSNRYTDLQRDAHVQRSAAWGDDANIFPSRLRGKSAADKIAAMSYNGMYSRNNDYVLYNDVAQPNNSNNTALRIHENTHALTETLPDGSNTIATFKRDIGKKVLLRGGLLYDEYLDSDDEIYSRMMDIRKRHGLSPDQKVDVDLLKKMRDVKGGDADFLNRYTDESLIDVMNNYAHNDIIPNAMQDVTREPVVYAAKDGGMVPAMSTGGNTEDYQPTSEIPTCWDEESQSFKSGMPRVIGMSGTDPIGEAYVTGKAFTKALDIIGDAYRWKSRTDAVNNYRDWLRSSEWNRSSNVRAKRMRERLKEDYRKYGGDGGIVSNITNDIANAVQIGVKWGEKLLGFENGGVIPAMWQGGPIMPWVMLRKLFEDSESPVEDSSRVVESPTTYTNQTVIDTYLNNVVYPMENPNRKGYRDALWHMYTDKDKSGVTHYNFGPGIERNSDAGTNLVYDTKHGYTTHQLNQALMPTLDKNLKVINEQLSEMYPELADTMSIGNKLILMDIAHNVRPRGKQANMPKRWPKLIKAMADGDTEAIKRETYSGSKRRQNMRNQLIWKKDPNNIEVENE